MRSMTRLTYVRQEAVLDADAVALQQRAAHDPAQHVAAVLVGGHDAVGDEEGHAARVVGQDPQRALVGLAGGQVAPERHERQELVGLEDRVDALLDERHAVEAQAGVDVLGRQRGQRPDRILVVLHEDEVPVLQEALVVAAGQVVGLDPIPGRDRGTARCTARTGPVGPACQKFSSLGSRTIRERGTPIASQTAMASSSGPRPSASSPSWTVIQMSSGLKPKPSSDSSHAYSAAPCLKYCADREVAEHLEEGQMARRGADVLDVDRAEALLAGRDERVRGGFSMPRK